MYEPILHDRIDRMSACPYCGSSKLVKEVPEEGGHLWIHCANCGERITVPEEEDEELAPER